MSTIVNISGTGDASYCYAQVNGTKYTKAASNITLTSNTIVFEIYGNGSGSLGKVTIDGATVVTSDFGNATYSWTVPSDVIEISIVLADKNNYTTIDVTTKKVVDPMAPHDGHNTNIGNAACEIDSGTVQIGGVLREIESGLVLVNGVAREVAFEKPMVTVSITGNGYMYNKIYASATINGSAYYSQITLNVPDGTEITLTVMSTYSRTYKATIDINGEQVVSVGKDTGTYVITAKTNMTIVLSTRSDRETGSISVTY